MEKVRPFLKEEEEEENLVVAAEEEVRLHGRKSRREGYMTIAISAGQNIGGVHMGAQHPFNGDHRREVESNLVYLDKTGGNEKYTDKLFASKDSTVTEITVSETENLPAVSAKPPEKQIEYATPSQNGNTSLIKEITPEVKEVYLEEVIKKPDTREFYCPHCNTCIQKVMLRGDGDTEDGHASAQCLELIRCTSCFSFLIPAGTTKKEQPHESSTTKKPPSSVTQLDQNVAPPNPENDSASVPSPAVSDGASMIGPQKPGMDAEADKKPVSTQPLEAVVIVGGKPSTDAKEEDKPGTFGKETPQTKPVLNDLTQTTRSTESRSDYKVEILKSIVYGGLIESITSLSIVTSAASAGATRLKIVALAIANLVGGLFVMGQNLWELRSDEPAEASGTRTLQVERYHALLGQRENFAIHALVTVLSYLIFGLIPPVVYGFSFQESNNTDFKLLAVAAASLICITVLAILKAHIQKPEYSVYFTTVLQYLLIGAMASGISYVAGDLIKKLMEKFGWLKSGVAIDMPLPEMDSGTLAWASY